MCLKLKIKGLDCANCANELEREIQKLDEVENATISFITERLELELGDNNKEEVLKKVKKVIKKEEPDVTIDEL